MRRPQELAAACSASTPTVFIPYGATLSQSTRHAGWKPRIKSTRRASKPVSTCTRASGRRTAHPLAARGAMARSVRARGCRALRDAYPTIRAEAYALLQADDRRQAETSGQIFEPYSSKATCNWRVVGRWALLQWPHLTSSRANARQGRRSCCDRLSATSIATPSHARLAPLTSRFFGRIQS